MNKRYIVLLSLLLLLVGSVYALTQISEADKLYYDGREVIKLETSQEYEAIQLYETAEPINKRYYLTLFVAVEMTRNEYDYVKQEMCKSDGRLTYCRDGGIIKR